MKYAVLILIVAATAGLQSSTQVPDGAGATARSVAPPASLVLSDVSGGGASARTDRDMPAPVLAFADAAEDRLPDPKTSAPAEEPVPAEAAPFECDGTATTDELLTSAREMFLSDNHALAELLYKCILRRDPNNVAAILELSVVYEKVGKLQYAKGLISRAAILRPQDRDIIDRNNELSRKLSNALRAEVDSLLSAGAFDAALPKLSVLLATDPGDAELHYKKAVCYLSLEDDDAALAEIQGALHLRKDPRYEALRAEAAGRVSTRDGAAKTRDAKRLAAAGPAEDREQALARVSEILSRDPENVSAQEEFRRLTSGDGAAADGESYEAPAAAVVRSLENAAMHVVWFAQGAAATIERHLALFIAALIVLILFRSPIAFMIARGFEPRQHLSGRLNYFNIHEVLSMIHAQGRSGVLWIYSPAARGRVYFSGGEIFHCTSGKLKGRDAVRRLLTSAKDGHFVLTKLPRAYKKTIDLPFSLVLMDIHERAAVDAVRVSPDDTPNTIHVKSKMKSLLEKKV